MPSLNFTFQIASLKEAQAIPPVNSRYSHACQILNSRQEGISLDVFPDIANRALRLRFDDEIIDACAGRVLPTTHDMAAIISFGHDLPNGASVLFHCYSGISRSSAAALIVAAGRLGVHRATEAARLIAGIRPHAEPNRLMLIIADDLLDARGALVSAGQQLSRVQRENRDAVLGGGWL